VTDADADKLIYCRCMDQARRRIQLLRTLSQGEFTSGDENADAEFGCLQLRKILEQVAFAALAANRELYSQVRAGFQREWQAKEFLRHLEKLHPDFYPVPVVPKRVGPKHIHCDFLTEGFLTRDEFVFLYDRCSSAIHDWNPYKPGPRVVDLERPIGEWAERLARLLSVHRIRLLGRPEILMVDVFHASGRARVLTGSPEAGS